MREYYQPVMDPDDVGDFIHRAFRSIRRNTPGIKSDEVVFALAFRATKKKSFVVCGCAPREKLAEIVESLSPEGSKRRITAKMVRGVLDSEFLAECEAKNRQPYVYYADTTKGLTRAGFDSAPCYMMGEN